MAKTWLCEAYSSDTCQSIATHRIIAYHHNTMFSESLRCEAHSRSYLCTSTKIFRVRKDPGEKNGEKNAKGK